MISIGRAALACLVALLVTPSVLTERVRSSASRKQRDLTRMLSKDDFKVKVQLFYMPQCPGCRQLISTSITEAFATDGFSDMANVEFIPWGQKHREGVKDRVFDNVLESCALRSIGKEHQDLQFMYIECIDRTGTFEIDPSKVDRSCAKVIGLTTEQTQEIETCAKSQEGHDLAEANLQQAISIEMEYAPWIVVNGFHSKETEDAVWNSLFAYVCDVYSGPYRSKECPNNQDLIVEQL